MLRLSISANDKIVVNSLNSSYIYLKYMPCPLLLLFCFPFLLCLVDKTDRNGYLISSTSTDVCVFIYILRNVSY